MHSTTRPRHLTRAHISAPMPYTGRDENNRPCPNRWTIYAYASPGSVREAGELWKHGRGKTTRYSVYLRGVGATMATFPSIDAALAHAGFTL